MRATVSTRMTFAALALLAGLSGCALPFTLSTPAGFARLETPAYSRYQYRAIAAYGVALAVRAESNGSHGDLDFWTEAVDRSVRQNGPYVATGTAEARSANGVRGRRLEYRLGEGAHGNLYRVLVFVTDARVYVLEVGGSEEAMARGRAAVEQSLASFATR